MKKLLLTSAGFVNPKIGQTFLELIGKPSEDMRILFIPTASRTPMELKYVDESQQELVDMGITAEHIITENLEQKVTLEQFQNINAVYVCGGNTFYLLDRVRKSGFDTVVKKLIEQDVVYLGVSAGSVLAGPDISISGPFDPNDVDLTDTTGLKLVDKVITPHYDKKEKSIIEDFKQKLLYPIITLTDNQALLVKGDEEVIIE